MPKTQPLKTLTRNDFIYSPITKPLPESNCTLKLQQSDPSDQVENDIPTKHLQFPQSASEREKYRTRFGKKVTPYQWAVYDFILKIPKGKVTTYKTVAEVAGGSPRSTGNALKVNPFSPYIPCHRVIASNLFIGGFFGEWAGRHKSTFSTEDAGGEQVEIKKKVALLEQEGVSVDARGFLVDRENAVWRPTSTEK